MPRPPRNSTLICWLQDALLFVQEAVACPTLRKPALS